MIATESALETVSFYVNGKWDSAGKPARAAGHQSSHWRGYRASGLRIRGRRGSHRPSRARGYLKWRDVPVVDRVQPLYRYKTLLEKHANELAAALTAENGKTIDDARMEVRRAIQMVEVACGMPSLMMGDSLNDVVERHRQPYHSPADRRLRRHHAVQFPGDGADVDVAVRHRLRATHSS